MSLSTLWQDCLSQLQDQVSPMDLSTWLRPLQADIISQDQVVLYASNMFVKKLGGKSLLGSDSSNLPSPC